MADDPRTQSFAAFRELVFEDAKLRMWLQVPLEREAYFEKVVALGAENGLSFDVDTVRAAARDGEQVWLMQGVEVVP